MEWIKPDINIDFVRRFRIGLSISAALIVLTALALLLLGGPALGVDFSGGLLVQVKFPKPTMADIDVFDIVLSQFGMNDE